MRLLRWVAAPIAALVVGIALLGVANAATENWVVDFEGLAEGSTPGVLTPGAGISGPSAGHFVTVSGPGLMIFDATCTGGCTGGDTDLFQPAQGNVMIISQDGDASDPDDATFGGTMSVAFSSFGVVTINSMTVLDQDDEGAASIQVFNGVAPVGAPIAVPATGDGGIVTVPIGLDGDRVELHLFGSGAMGDVSFSAEVENPPPPLPPPPPPPPNPAEITVTKVGGEAGVTYDFELTHGVLKQVDSFSLETGQSHTQILFLGASYSVAELGAPAGVQFSSGCSGGAVLPGASVTCTVTNPAPPTVLGTSAIVEKLLATSDPALVGETVKFYISTTITGDETVSSAGLIDTFENTYLGFVSADPACTLIPNMPDATHSMVACDIGEVTPGTPGNPGSLTFTYLLTFEALQPTEETVDGVVAVIGTQEIGPATDSVEIIDILGVQLPPAGDGSVIEGESTASSVAIILSSLVLAVSGLWLAQGAVIFFGARDLWTRRD